jgi:adenylate cyclase
MNRYLTPMTNAIIARKGTIDKYIGDAIMAFWNAPLDDADHEANACAAALDMLERLKHLNDEFEREAEETGDRYLPFRIGIGVNTGQCVVGNLGSDFRFDYSVLGDSVNLASRLEGRSKDYGVAIVLGSGTAAAAQHRFATLEIDLVQVKGKSDPDAAFALLGGEDLLRSARFAELRPMHARMLAQYRAQDWSAATESVALCRKAADGFGLDALYQLYLDRIDYFRANPPPPDWNGVSVYDSK